ncbi:MAG: hypothetical protein BWY63_00657 [Chloroflexi bacterium ADurb.Bin360]|nr:MAG: hypothetical protein BWY63_00657 [Chloroflexi bacterium ADurb.Bin360]
MDLLDQFESLLTLEELQAFRNLNSPAAIQAYLDETPYSAEERTRSPLNVMRDRVAHCLDGGLFAAAALRRLGYPPLLVDMLPEPETDDDHVLAIFKEHGCLGAVAKSNFVGLRYREPIYRTVRELVLSYFEAYYNVNGKKTLRTYTRIFDLARFDRHNWMWDETGVEIVERHLYSLKSIPLITPEMTAQLQPVDPLTYQAGMLVVNPAGLYRPRVEAGKV